MSGERGEVLFRAAPASWRVAVVEAVVIAAVAAASSVVVNAVRPDRLPWVADTPYQTLVPCPEPGGPVQAVAPRDRTIASDRTFLIDARTPEEYAALHLPGAVNVPYDWLDPIPDDVMRALAAQVAASGAARVVVYGDGGRPDSGEYLGREISARGINNVFFVDGGAPAVLPTGDSA